MVTEHALNDMVWWCRGYPLTPPPRPLVTTSDLDRLVAHEPALRGWRKVGYGCVRFVQSWEHRPTRREWIRLKRLIRFRMPFQIIVEFRGCPRRQ